MIQLFTGSGVASTLFYLSVCIFLGIILGRFKIKGVSLGITWILFAGIVVSAIGVSLNADMLHVIKEFGLILFVTAVGFQVGPDFFRSFKSGGLSLNLCAVAIVALGVLATVVVSLCTDTPLDVMVGVYTGAVTNTPGMSAAQQVVAEQGGDPTIVASGYAVAYPLGVVGLIATCLLLRPICRIDLKKEPLTDAASSGSFNKQHSLSAPRHKNILIPIFVVIALGILLGSISFGSSTPIKLGLAGGPLVVALFASWYGIKKQWISPDLTGSHGVWMLREVGITLFLAAVGLSAGGSFVSTIAHGGYMWILYGVIITMLPELIVAIFARLVLHVNYYTLMGFIGGATTDPPTLAFANSIAPEGCKLPNIGYATVYPLTMFLRILSAQLILIL